MRIATGIALVLGLGLATGVRAQAADQDFCSGLWTAIGAANQPEPFASLRKEPEKAQGYTTLTLPGFTRCYAGRMGASPPGVPTFVCRQREAPADLTRNSLAEKTAACLGQTPNVDDRAALYFVVSSVRIAMEEVGAEKRTVVFQIEVPPAPQAAPEAAPE